MKKKKYKIIITIFMILLVFSQGLSAEESEDSQAKEESEDSQTTEAAEELKFNVWLDDIKVNWYVVPTGGVMGYSLGSFDIFEDLTSRIEGKIAAGYESYGNNRNDLTGDPVWWDETSSESFGSPNAQWEVGFRQGIIPLNEDKDMLSALVSYHGRVSFNPWEQIESIFPDRNHSFINSFLLGVYLDNTEMNPHGQKSGITSVIEGELGPAVLSYEGTDFWRLKAQVTGYIPMFDLENENNLFNGYLVGRLNAKYIEGEQVPVFMLKGTDVRGYPVAMSTKLRVFSAIEARFNLPSIINESDLLPMIYIFADNGFYYGYNDLVSGSTFSDSYGFLGSFGAGFLLDIYRFAQPYVHIAVPYINSDSASKNLYDTGYFSVSFGFATYIM